MIAGFNKELFCQATQAAVQRTPATESLQVDVTTYHPQTITIGSRHKRSAFKKVGDIHHEWFIVKMTLMWRLKYGNKLTIGQINRGLCNTPHSQIT